MPLMTASGFLVLLQHLDTDIHVGTFVLVVKRLSDIVKQAGPLRQLYIQPQLASHQTGQVSHFDRMLQNILTVRSSVPQSAQQLDQLR